MSIPTQTEMFPIVLDFMTDGVTRSNKEIQNQVVASLNLADDELALRTSTGVPTAENRVGWSIQHLQRAQLLNRVARGTYVISDEGRKLAAKKLESQEFASYVRNQIAERNPWNIGADSEKQVEAEPIEESEVSPQESIDAAISNLNSALADELLDTIQSKSPEFFEKLVVDLLEAMGYGKGKVTQYSNDGGIDGMITTDALGFDPIYTQAKRFCEGNTIGRPDIQKFAGALGHYTRGIFITTSTFAKSAYEYAATYPHATIILIDGRKLAELMIQYNLGVSTERAYQIKRIDIDYFEQD